jgi:hypothetical protein
MRFLGNKFPDGSTTHRVVHRRDHVSGFVQRDVGENLGRLDAISVKCDDSGLGICTLAQHGHATVHPDTPSGNELLTGAPRTVSSLRKDLL